MPAFLERAGGSILYFEIEQNISLLFLSCAIPIIGGSLFWTENRVVVGARIGVASRRHGIGPSPGRNSGGSLRRRRGEGTRSDLLLAKDCPSIAQIQVGALRCSVCVQSLCVCV